MTAEEHDEVQGQVGAKPKRDRPPATPEDLVALVPALTLLIFRLARRRGLRQR